MKKMLILILAALSLSLAARPARAEFGTADSVPAATLLLPYFEVDLANGSGVTTLLSINNASASAVLAHVTLWTDQSIPTTNFDLYLTGYDVQTINLRDVFNGNLPRTSDAGADPTDTISPKGVLSQDINFPGGAPGVKGPCGDTADLYVNPALDAATVAHLRAAHTGQNSAVLGGCAGSNQGDNVARGYVTIDAVNSCNLLFPSDAGYFSTVSTLQNILWGDYFFVDSANNFAQGDSLVSIEACAGATYTSFAGTGGACPLAPGDYTFYGRYVAAAATDGREPLATTFLSRYINGGTFSGGTDLLVWRDTKLPPTGANGAHSCAAFPTWYPLPQSDVVSFDETENPTDLCFLTDNVAPVIGGTQPCFPLAAQRVDTGSGNLLPPAPFGMFFLNLNFSVASDPFPGVAQGWVSTVMDANGRFSVGYRAIALDNALATNPGGVLLLP